MTPAEDIQPCPFCGSRNIAMMYSMDTHTCWLMCKQCEAEGPATTSEKWARIHWDDQKSLRRVIELEAEIARLKEWQGKALPHLKNEKTRIQFVDFDDGEDMPYALKDIADLTALIAQAQGGER